MVKADTKWGVELITNAVCAIRAIAGVIVCDVAGTAECREEVVHVLSASLAGRRGEVVQLLRRANDW